MADDVKPGFEEIDLDLSRVPSVEVGLSDAADRYKRFADFAIGAMKASDDHVLFESHIPLYSFVNRAVSLHAGIVSAVKETNPHSAFTLLRAYLELIILVRYLDLHPDYLEALKRSKADLPKGARKQMWELFADAATEMRGVRYTYDTLSEMAHFGSTAMWHPFTIGDEPDDRVMSYGTAPHWKKPDDARIVLGMLEEADDAVMVVLERYRDHHVAPLIDRHVIQQRTSRKLAALSDNPPPDPGDDATLNSASLSPELARDGLAAGVIAPCEEHQALEVAPGVSPDQFEAWVEARMQRRIGEVARELYGEGIESFFATPLKSLAERTPREAIDAGDSDTVFRALEQAKNAELT